MKLRILPEGERPIAIDPSVRAERRSAQRRAADAATVLLFRDGVGLAAMQSVALLLATADRIRLTDPAPDAAAWPSALSALLAVCGVLLGLWWLCLWGFQRRRRLQRLRWQDTRIWLRGLSTLMLLNLFAFGSLAGSAVHAAPAHWMLLTALHGVLALTVAASVNGPTVLSVGSIATLAWPAWAWLDGGEPVGGSIGLGLAGLALLALWPLQRQARRWRRVSRRLVDAGDRVRNLTAERDAAVRADHDKLRFVAAASHDLRQPMHALGLFVATLEGRLQGTPDEALAHNMMRSVETLDRSFSALLDISRLDAGTVQPNPQRFQLRDLFRRLHMHFAGVAEERGLGLRFSPGGKTVTSDPQLLERVLANLIQNALRYTQQGGVVVVARSTATHINLEVWDSGSGIAPADLPRIFDEFYRAHPSEREAGQGLGMGLAIVKRLLRLLGHTLEVQSIPGRGTMFRVGVPIGSAPDVADATAAADTIPAPVLQAGHILVIDDEADIRLGLSHLLRAWGFEADAAADIAEARAIAQRLGPRLDLVISDLHLLDGEDGLDAIAAVRAACGRPVQAMVITGDTSPAEIRRASASGHMLLFKPVQPSKLFGVLRSIVQ
jgi:signal transduction histidine kinase/CheY-like chemotaxis protein